MDEQNENGGGSMVMVMLILGIIGLVGFLATAMAGAGL